MADHPIPTRVAGTPVEVVGDPMTTGIHCWRTLIPTDPSDGRIWEFDTNTGKLILAHTE